MALSLSSLSDMVALNIGAFERGKWDYIGLGQLYPELEVLGQLVPRKGELSNYEKTVVYQLEDGQTPQPTKPGAAITPSQTAKALRRKVKAVKVVDHIGWTLDQDTLKGKSDEHIVKQIQMDLVGFDLRWWEFLENSLLRMADNIVPEDDEHMFGFPAWITDDADISADTFQLYGGDDPYATGRPGGIAVAAQPKYTNPVIKFSVVSDDNLFSLVEKFLIHRKLMGAVPNPRLVPDTPANVWYMQEPLYTQITSYLTASNENVGMDAGRYRGKPTYKGMPMTVWHALGHPDSPVAPSTCQSYIIDWNSFEYGTQPEYDRKIDGPEDINLVPSGKYITSETWHQLVCQRPDRNCKLVSDTASLQP